MGGLGMPAGFSVTCESCQRRYPWKKELAGKRGKCKCGHVIAMPMALPRQESDDDLYHLSELASDAKSADVDPTPIVAPAAAVAAVPAYFPAKGRHLDDGGAPSFSRDNSDGLTAPIRDLYVPLAMLIAAAAVSMAWLISPTKPAAGSLALVPLFMWVITLVDVAIPMALSMYVAAMFGLGFGSLGSTLLKFGSLVFCIAAAQLWLPAVLKATGSMSASGQAPMLYVLLLEYCFATLFIALASMLLFRMDVNEMALLAITYLVVGILFDLLVALIAFAIVGAVNSKTAAAPPPPAAAVPVATATAAFATPAPAAAVPTVFDRVVGKRIHDPNLAITEGNQWKQSNHFLPADKAIDGLIDQMYAAGAVTVYIDAHARPHPMAYVQLPQDNAKIKACTTVAHDYRQANGFPPSPAADRLMRTYVVVLLKR
jgi:hypothetical protein